MLNPLNFPTIPPMSTQETHTIEPGSTIGIVGGGQLGRMMALAAANLGYQIIVYSPEEEAPAAHVSAKHICASYDDKEQLTEFAKQVDIITLEFENIPHISLQILSKFVEVWPHWEVLRIAQNRIREKDFLNECGVPTTAYKAIHSSQELKGAITEFNYPVVLKTTELGYDGKGQYVIQEHTDIDALWKEAEHIDVSGDGASWICEQYVPFIKEMSVMVARSTSGEVMAYDPSENVHKDGMLRTSYAPAIITNTQKEQAQEIAIKLVEKLGYVGILAIEYFVINDEQLLVNEVAPRPHNSGHWTMDACITSQFEQHIRAICNLPLGSVSLICKVEMHNLIGDEIHAWSKGLSQPNVKFHSYGKKEARKGRKMGHINRLLIEH